MSVQVPDPTVFHDRIKESLAELKPVTQPSAVGQTNPQTFHLRCLGGVFQVSGTRMRETLHRCRHLERIKTGPRSQHADGSRSAIPCRLYRPYRIRVVLAAGIAEHPNFPADDVLQGWLTGIYFSRQFRSR